jgi:hypothetical protein
MFKRPKRNGAWAILNTVWAVFLSVSELGCFQLPTRHEPTSPRAPSSLHFSQPPPGRLHLPASLVPTATQGGVAGAQGRRPGRRAHPEAFLHALPSPSPWSSPPAPCPRPGSLLRRPAHAQTSSRGSPARPQAGRCARPGVLLRRPESSPAQLSAARRQELVPAVR